MSNVYGSLSNGIFDGRIATGDGHFFTVERLNKFYDLKINNLDHSIIYLDKDVSSKKRRTKRNDSGEITYIFLIFNINNFRSQWVWAFERKRKKDAIFARVCRVK